MPLIIAFVLAGVGLGGIYRHLRERHETAVVWLTLALLAGATPLTTALAGGSALSDLAAFAIVGALMALVGQDAASRWRRMIAPAAILAMPLLLQPTSRLGSEAGVLMALFSPSSGLLSLTPVMYVAALGTLIGLRTRPGAAIVALMAVVLWAMAGASVVPAVAVLAPGLSVMIGAARARPMFALAPCVAFVLVWNYWLMVQYTVGTVPKDEPVSFATLVRGQATVATAPPYRYPFAFPANVLYGWWHDVPASRFDTLAPVPAEPAFDLVMDRRADRFLLEGWDAPGAEPAGPAWWIGGRRATLVFPLEPPDRAVTLEVTSRARLDEPAMNVDVGVEINGHELGRFIAMPAAPTVTRFEIPAARIGDVLRAGYNRLTIVSHAIHRADPADTRAPGPLARRFGDRAFPVAIFRIRLTPAS